MGMGAAGNSGMLNQLLEKVQGRNLRDLRGIFIGIEVLLSAATPNPATHRAWTEVYSTPTKHLPLQIMSYSCRSCLLGGMWSPQLSEAVIPQM